MTTLRVLLQGAPDAGTAVPWALFDAAGVRTSSGMGAPAQWPDATQREALLDANSARVVALTLPPLPAQRLAAAVRFALDDQLAAPGETLHVAVTRQARDGSVRAVVIDRALHDALRAWRPRFTRVLALPTLHAADGDWHWFDGAHTGDRYLLRADGSALGAEEAAGSEVAMALRDARSRGTPVARVLAHGVDTAMLQRAAAGTQVAWVAVPAWRWVDASPAAFAQAIDVLEPAHAETGGATGRAALRRALRPARRLAMAAVAVFMVGLVGTWIHARYDAWQDERALQALALSAGIADANSGAAAATAIAARYRDTLHAQGKAAADDAWPLLANVAPALASLPRGTLRRATYSGGAWTFELAAMDATAQAALARSATAAGVNALTAASANGVRMRVTH